MARSRRSFHRRSPKRKVAAKTFKVICARCGKELWSEVAPPAGAALLCVDCYRK